MGTITTVDGTETFSKDWETVSGYLNRTETGNNG